MAVPRPGRPVRGSTTGRPIMVLLDLLGRRGSLRILWELRTARMTFRELVSAAETNPGVLNARLTELRGSNLIDHDGSGYGLSTQGLRLLAHLAPLHQWAEQWAQE
jgi:DNA-binding HxlR family transcriptional regulator